MSHSHRLNWHPRVRVRGSWKVRAKPRKHHSVTRCSRVGQNTAPRDEEEGLGWELQQLSLHDQEEMVRGLFIVSLKCIYRLL